MNKSAEPDKSKSTSGSPRKARARLKYGAPRNAERFGMMTKGQVYLITYHCPSCASELQMVSNAFSRELCCAKCSQRMKVTKEFLQKEPV